MSKTSCKAQKIFYLWFVTDENSIKKTVKIWFWLLSAAHNTNPIQMDVSPAELYNKNAWNASSVKH